MILQTGILYGLLTDVFIYLLYNRVLRRVMNYYMAHVLQFLHLTSNVPNSGFDWNYGVECCDCGGSSNVPGLEDGKRKYH